MQTGHYIFILFIIILILYGLIKDNEQNNKIAKLSLEMDAEKLKKMQINKDEILNSIKQFAIDNNKLKVHTLFHDDDGDDDYYYDVLDAKDLAHITMIIDQEYEHIKNAYPHFGSKERCIKYVRERILNEMPTHSHIK